jgi:hypothetical protein
VVLKKIRVYAFQFNKIRRLRRQRKKRSMDLVMLLSINRRLSLLRLSLVVSGMKLYCRGYLEMTYRFLVLRMIIIIWCLLGIKAGGIHMFKAVEIFKVEGIFKAEGIIKASSIFKVVNFSRRREYSRRWKFSRRRECSRQ